MTVQLYPSISQSLNGRKLVLASSSPRRRELLARLGIPFDVVPSTFPEQLDKSAFDSPSGYVCANAVEKANEVFDRLESTSPVVIGSDTIVVIDNRILEKPPTHDAAKSMLRTLSGREHTVLTAVTIMSHGNRHEPDTNTLTKPRVSVHTFVEETRVQFGVLAEDVIELYVDSGEPMDKAGGYGYQALASMLVSGINGCYYNCVGFPLYRFASELNSLATRGEL